MEGSPKTLTPEYLEAFVDELYHACFNKLFAAARRFVRNQDDVDVIMQETFLTAWEKREALAVKDEPEKWLMETLKNKAHEVNRARKTLNKMIANPAATGIDIEEFADTSGDDIQTVVRRFREVLVDSGKLSREEFGLFLRLAFDADTVKELSQGSNVKPEACKKRIQRARSKARNCRELLN